MIKVLHILQNTSIHCLQYTLMLLEHINQMGKMLQDYFIVQILSINCLRMMNFHRLFTLRIISQYFLMNLNVIVFVAKNLLLNL